ncbi:hypothetical protein ACLB1R_15370 [Escherichia coli]
MSDTFLPNARFFDELHMTATCCIPPCAGLSQALLDATALATGGLKTGAGIDEWQLPRVAESIPLFWSGGGIRYITPSIRMILKGIDVLPVR